MAIWLLPSLFHNNYCLQGMWWPSQLTDMEISDLSRAFKDDDHSLFLEKNQRKKSLFPPLASIINSVFLLSFLSIHVLVPRTCDYVTLHRKRLIILRLRGRGSGFSENVQCNHMRPWNWRTFSASEQREMRLQKNGQRCSQLCSTGNLLALKMKEGAMNQRIPEAGKRQGNGFSLRVSKKEYSPTDTVNFVQWDLCWSSNLGNFKVIYLCSFKQFVATFW